MAERRYQIHPAIGIARVGNAVRGDTSNDFFYIGPEFPDVAANIDPVSALREISRPQATGGSSRKRQGFGSSSMKSRPMANFTR